MTLPCKSECEPVAPACKDLAKLKSNLVLDCNNEYQSLFDKIDRIYSNQECVLKNGTYGNT